MKGSQMIMIKKKVLIARCGGWGNLNAKNGDFDNQIDLLTDQLKKYCNDSSLDLQIDLEIQVVSKQEEIIHELAQQKQVHSIIFLTSGMIDFSKVLKKEFPSLNVVLFTADFPEDEIKIIGKNWFLNPETIWRIII